MKLVDHVRRYVARRSRAPTIPFSIESHGEFSHTRALYSLTRRHPNARRWDRERERERERACVFADKAETLELYISILGLDKRYENPSSLGLGFTSYCSREQFWSGRRSTAAWKKRDRGKEGESEERREVLFCSLCGESIVRSRPSPWKEGKGPGNEGDRSFLAYYRRSKVSPILRPSSLVAHGQMVTISRQSIPTHLRKKTPSTLRVSDETFGNFIVSPLDHRV